MRFNCPVCDNTITVDRAAAGKRGRCHQCNELIRIPVLPGEPKDAGKQTEPIEQLIAALDEPDAAPPQANNQSEPKLDSQFRLSTSSAPDHGDERATDSEPEASLSLITIRGKPVWALAALLIGVVIAAGVFVISRGEPASRMTLEAIQDELEMWPLSRESAILRGRPLTKVSFTTDASRFDRPPLFDVYFDAKNQPVAVTASVAELQPPAPKIFAEKLDVFVEIAYLDLVLSGNVDPPYAYEQFRAFRKVLTTFVGNVPLTIKSIQLSADARRIDDLRTVDTETAETTVRHHLFEASKCRVELMTSAGTDPPEWYHWIVKLPSW